MRHTPEATSTTGVTTAIAVVASAAVAMLTLSGCAQRAAVASPPVASSVTQTTTSTPTPTPSLCPEFHVSMAAPNDIEGWWSSSPADADGNILTDPARWPEQLREHPRVALVDTDTRSVISTWDRRTCGPDDSYQPIIDAGWPAGSIAVMDMDTGALISTLDKN
jgi:hypothetical protein